jgi:hypothetical protein
MFQRFSFLSLPSIAFALWVLPSSGAAAARKDSPETRRPAQMEHFISRMEKELELAPAQTAEVRRILLSDSMAMPPEGFHREGPHGPGMMFGDEFLAQLRSESVDTATLNRTFAERMAWMQGHHAQMVAKFAQLHLVLTPAQRLKLADILEKRHHQEAAKRRKK